MRALLDDLALVEHHEPVHRRDGREPVRDGNHRLVAHQRATGSGSPPRLRCRARQVGLIEHEDRRALEQHPRDGNPLPLPARELDAALADMGVEAGAALHVHAASR